MSGKNAIISRLAALVMATLFGLLVAACLLLSNENARLRKELEEERAEEVEE